MGRTSLDLLAGAEVPLELGRFTLSPGVGLGAEWIQSRRANEVIPLCVADGTCAWTLGPIVNDGLSRSHFAFIGELRLRGELRLSESFALSTGASVTVSPFDEREAILPSYASNLPLAERSGLALDPEPRVVFRGSIGLTWGPR